MSDEATMKTALTERLAQLRAAEVQAAYQLGRAAGAVAEVALLLSGFDAPGTAPDPGVGIGEAEPAAPDAGPASPAPPDE